MLGGHINAKADQIPWIAKTKPRLMKVLLNSLDRGWLAEARAASPSTFWVGRWVADCPIGTIPIADVASYTGRLLPVLDQFEHLLNAVEGPNEPACDNMWDTFRLAIFEAERSRILHAEGWKSVVGNFSVGMPQVPERDPAIWRAFYPALEAGDYLGVHEYGSWRMDDPASVGWLCCRYRKVYESLPPELRKPLIVTETGIDSGRGWKAHTDAAGYMAQLAWYDAQLQRDAKRWPIVGATVFCYGQAANWGDYDIQGEMAEYLAAYMQANPPTVWKPKEEEKTDALLDLLMTTFGTEFDDIRAVLQTAGTYDKRDLSRVQYAVIHHSGPPTTPETWSSTIANYHTAPVGQDGPDGHPWPGIGYHFLVYPWKVRYCGDIDTSRYNVGDYNPQAIGICLVGDFMQEPPDPHTVDLTRRLCDLLDGFLGRKVQRLGHRDLAPTDLCPGDSAYGPDGWLAQIVGALPPTDEIAQLRAQVAALQAQVVDLTADKEQDHLLLAAQASIIRRVKAAVE